MTGTKPSRRRVDVSARRIDQFLAEVDAVPSWGACWPWNGRFDRKGYGRFRFGGRDDAAYRYAFTAAFGGVPAGLQLDHLCRVRRCVNPLHLEPVTSAENTLRSPVAVTAVNARKTHCAAGHEYASEHGYVYTRPSGESERRCRTCARQYARQRKAVAA